MFRSCNKTRFISRIWLRFDTVNKLMWLCKNRTCEFKAYKVELSAQSEWRKLTLPGQSFAYKWKFEVLGLQIKAKSNTFLWTASWCQLLFFFLFWLAFFVELCFFVFSFFFFISLNGRSFEKQRTQMSEISWGRRALRCEINRLYALLNNLVRVPIKRKTLLIFLLGMPN